MADELVREYWLNYRPASETVRIWIRTDSSGWQLVNELPVEKAVFLSDMLRSETPVYWITGNVSLHTQGEPVGEEES